MKKTPTFFVIGGANIDCVATPHYSIHHKDSNPATIKTSYGGVASNIAQNLAHLNQNVKFLTVFSKDGFGKDIKKYLELLQIDTQSCLTVDEPTSMYMAMLDDSQDLLLAMVDTSILDHINSNHIRNFLQSATSDDVVVFDTNLNDEIIASIINHAKGKIVCDPISIEKSIKVKAYLNRLSIFKPNMLQASTLSKITINNNESLIKTALHFREEGVKKTLITCGDEGGLYIDSHQIIRFSQQTHQIVNAVGAGDAFLATFIAFESSYDTIETLKLSISAAYLTCQCADTVDPTLSIEKIKNVIEKLDIVIEVIDKGV